MAEVLNEVIGSETVNEIAIDASSIGHEGDFPSERSNTRGTLDRNRFTTNMILSDKKGARQ